MASLSFYERNYPRILAAVAGTAVAAGIFVAGYAKGTRQDLSGLAGQLMVASASVLGSAWEQTAGTEPVHFLQPSRKPGAGVTVNAVPQRADLVLLTGFFDGMPGLRLIRRDGTVVARWRAAFSELVPELKSRVTAPKTDWNIDLHGSEIAPDGSVLFNFEYQAVVQLDRCGAKDWVLPERNHHSIAPAAGGGYWIGGRTILGKGDDAAFRPLTNPLRAAGWIEDDEVMKVSAGGEILARKSVFALMMESGLEPLLTANGTPMRGGRVLDDNEILHLNHIEELSRALAPAFPQFAAGDLLLSVRDFNLVMVVDPESWRVKWHSVGPWLRQHAARFLPDGRIGVFNNNSYSWELAPDGRTDPAREVHSNILAVDPQSGRAEVLYGDGPDEDLASVERGFVQPLPGGGAMVTEALGGRAFQIGPDRRIVWEYINRFDDARVVEITSAKVYPAGFFTVTDWSCP